eukprot:7199809-Pyramimonas_sp.AAC.1
MTNTRAFNAGVLLLFPLGMAFGAFFSGVMIHHNSEPCVVIHKAHHPVQLGIKHHVQGCPTCDCPACSACPICQQDDTPTVCPTCAVCPTCPVGMVLDCAYDESQKHATAVATAVATAEKAAEPLPQSDQSPPPVNDVSSKAGGVESVNSNQAAKTLFETYPAPAPLL